MHISGLQQDPSYTYEHISESSFLIGGVTSLPDEWILAYQLMVGEILANAFRDERSDIQILPAGAIYKALGTEKYQNLLNQYRLSGLIAPNDVADIRIAFPNVRYLLLARVNESHVFEKKAHTETDVSDSKKDNKKDEYEFVKVEVSLIRWREVSASLLIFDMHQGQIAWSGQVSHSRENTNSDSNTYKKDDRWKNELVNSLFNTMLGQEGYPKAPTEEVVLRSIFTGFAENMPEKKKH